ncbi:MAG: hypothetical protein K2J51_02325 [Alistipes sp.]|nr:hypothetical protein [Alistipes sp.]MDE6857637.1 hypothetical protein [Alistipes sp.]
MKHFKLWALVASLFAAAGFVACDDDDNTAEENYLDRVEIVANWKVVSWTERGSAVADMVDTYWVITKRTIAAGDAEPVAYTFSRDVLSFSGEEYAVSVEERRMSLRNAERSILFVEVDEIPGREPGPDEPEDPETPFEPVAREELYGAWVATSVVSAPSYSAGAYWTFDERTVGIDGVKYGYEYCSTTHNLLTFDGARWSVVLEGEGDGRTLTLACAEEGSKSVVTLAATVLPLVSYYPTAGTPAYKDGRLEMTFPAAAPQLGKSGSIRIFKADGTEVDRIDMADILKDRVKMAAGQTIHTAMNVIGNRSVKRYRIVYYDPVAVEGNKLCIYPHYDVLDYGETYYVTVDPEAVVSDDFDGISDPEQWRFTVKSAPTSSTVTVAATGDADFRTVQAAIDYGYDLGRDASLTVDIMPGEYRELLFTRYNNNITLRGRGTTNDDVRIHYPVCDNVQGGVGGSTSVSANPYAKPAVGDAIPYSGGRCTMLIESCDNLRFENLTLENSWYRISSENNQAEALYNNDNSGDCGIVFVRCKLLSRQDTLNLKGYCWFYDCLVAGDVDFIWGGATAALFEKCEIRSVTDGGYILQARVNQTTSQGYRMGFVFMDCSLTKGSGVNSNSTYLARKGDTTESNITFINCRMDNHVRPEGWHGTGPYYPETMDALHGLKEYNTTDLSGNALNLSSRNKPSYILTSAEVEQYYKDRAMIFSGYTKNAVWSE